MRRARRLHLLLGGAAVTALLVVATYAVAGTSLLDGSDGPLPGGVMPEIRAASDAARSAPTVADIKDGIAALKRPSGAVLPARLRAVFGQGRLHQRFAPDPSQARLVTPMSSKVAVWLVPGVDSVCLAVVAGPDDGGLTCQLAAADATHLSITRRDPNGAGQQLIGVAPDDVDHVLVRYSDGTHSRVDVANNVYVVENGLGLAGVTY